MGTKHDVRCLWPALEGLSCPAGLGRHPRFWGGWLGVALLPGWHPGHDHGARPAGNGSRHGDAPAQVSTAPFYFLFLFWRMQGAPGGCVGTSPTSPPLKPSRGLFQQQRGKAKHNNPGPLLDPSLLSPRDGVAGEGGLGLRPVRAGGGGKVFWSCICLFLPASLFALFPLRSLSFLFRLCLVFYSAACAEEGVVSSQHPSAPYPDISARRSAFSPSP